LAELGDIPHDPQPMPLDAVVDLPAGTRRLSGTVPDVCRHLVVGVTASRIGPKDLLRAWVRAAALTAAVPDGGWEVVTVGRDGTKRGDAAAVEVQRVSMRGPDAALEALAFLDDLCRRALCDALPVVAATSHALWCEPDSLGAARKAFRTSTGQGLMGDCTDRWVAMALGTEFDDLLELEPRDDEPVPSGAGAGARARWWAEQLWGTFEATTGLVLRAPDSSGDVEVAS
jgi:exodeoxyribonuclease V gamma subunit